MFGGKVILDFKQEIEYTRIIIINPGPNFISSITNLIRYRSRKLYECSVYFIYSRQK